MSNSIGPVIPSSKPNNGSSSILRNAGKEIKSAAEWLSKPMNAIKFGVAAATWPLWLGTYETLGIMSCSPGKNGKKGAAPSPTAQEQNPPACIDAGVLRLDEPVEPHDGIFDGQALYECQETKDRNITIVKGNGKVIEFQSEKIGEEGWRHTAIDLNTGIITITDRWYKQWVYKPSDPYYSDQLGTLVYFVQKQNNSTADPDAKAFLRQVIDKLSNILYRCDSTGGELQLTPPVEQHNGLFDGVAYLFSPKNCDGTGYSYGTQVESDGTVVTFDLSQHMSDTVTYWRLNLTSGRLETFDNFPQSYKEFSPEDAGYLSTRAEMVNNMIEQMEYTDNPDARAFLQDVVSKL